MDGRWILGASVGRHPWGVQGGDAMGQYHQDHVRPTVEPGPEEPRSLCLPPPPPGQDRTGVQSSQSVSQSPQ